MKKVILQAHRGDRVNWPENSLMAFQKAYEIGVSAVELDVCISQDFQLIVSHEPWMRAESCLTPDGKRINEETGKATRFYELSANEIQSYRCGELPQKNFPEQHLYPVNKPLLKDVLKWAANLEDPIFLNIEIKSHPEWYNSFQAPPDVYALKLFELLQNEAKFIDYQVQSFDENFLGLFHRLSPDTRNILLHAQHDGNLKERFEKLNFPPDGVGLLHGLITPETVEWCEENSLRLAGWTINDLQQVDYLLELGLRNFTTDYPLLLKKHLLKQGYSII